MAIQNRRGNYSDFAGGANLADGEFGIVMSGDTNTDDGTGTYISNGGGIVHRLLTDDDKAELIAAISDLTKVYKETFDDSVTGFRVSARKSGGVLTVQLSGTITISATGWTVLGTLSESLRPAYSLPYFSIMCQGTATHHLLLSVLSNGQVRVNASATFSGVYFNDGATWLAR